MLFLSLVVALFVCQPSFAEQVQPSSYVAKRAKKQVSKKATAPIEAESIQFLTLLNEAFRQNGLDVFSEKKIQGLPQEVLKKNYNYKYDPWNKRFLLLKDSFITFMEKMFIKNSIILPEQYQVSLPNLPPFQNFLVQHIVRLAQDVRGTLEENRKIDFISVLVDFELMLEYEFYPESIMYTYQSLFPEEQVDFTEICSLCQHNGLDVPTHYRGPIEFLYDFVKLNTSKDEIKTIKELPTNRCSLFTKWLILSLKEALSYDNPDQGDIRCYSLLALFSLLYEKE